MRRETQSLYKIDLKLLGKAAHWALGRHGFGVEDGFLGKEVFDEYQRMANAKASRDRKRAAKKAAKK